MSYLKLNFKAQTLNRTVDAHVFLPDDAVEPVSPPYKTLYFLPGLSGDALELLTGLGLRRQCQLKGIALVVINGENSFYLNFPQVKAYYADFVTDELIRFTRSLLPLSHRAEDTFLAGISMGGYRALRNGLLHPEVFGKVAGMSSGLNFYRIGREIAASPFQAENFDHLFGSEEALLHSDLSPRHILLESGKKPEELPKLFLGCGTSDSFVYAQHAELFADLRAANFPFTCWEGEGGHDLDCWERMLDSVFSFLCDIPVGSKNAYPMV